MPSAAPQPAMRPSHHYGNALLLTLAGGFLDAYTYSCRGGVFANAQTGNTVKMAISLAQGQYWDALRFLIPILSFFLGVLLAIQLETCMERRKIHFIRRGILLLEMVIVLAVSLIPQGRIENILANTLVSLLCAMQMEGFKTFIGQPITTTVATGNLRKFIEFTYRALHTGDMQNLRIAISYLTTVAAFCVGAAIGTWVTDLWQIRAILFTELFYLASFLTISIIWKRMGLPIREPGN